MSTTSYVILPRAFYLYACTNLPFDEDAGIKMKKCAIRDRTVCFV